MNWSNYIFIMLLFGVSHSGHAQINIDSINFKYGQHILYPTDQSASLNFFKTRFPGCEDKLDEVERDSCSLASLNRFFRKHFQWPVTVSKTAAKQKIEAAFWIDRSGLLVEETVLVYYDSALAQEVLRVLSLIREKKIYWSMISANSKVWEVRYRISVDLEKLE